MQKMCARGSREWRMEGSGSKATGCAHWGAAGTLHRLGRQFWLSHPARPVEAADSPAGWSGGAAWTHAVGLSTSRCGSGRRAGGLGSVGVADRDCRRARCSGSGQQSLQHCGSFRCRTPQLGGEGQWKGWAETRVMREEGMSDVRDRQTTGHYHCCQARTARRSAETLHPRSHKLPTSPIRGLRSSAVPSGVQRAAPRAV